MGTPENTKFCDFTSTKNNNFICTPIAPPAPEANFYEIKPAWLNLVMKEKFSGASSDDAAAHLNNFVELCEMQKYKDVDGNIIKLKLFPFFLRGRAKDWLLYLPRNSIDSWDKCKDVFIGKYYPPAKIIATIIGRILLPMVMVMVTLMVIPPTALGACPVRLKSCSRTSSVSKLLLTSLLRKS
jgi:hypothetical protein